LIGPTWLFVGVASCTGAVLVATFGRTGGRWWYQAVAGHRRFVRRRRRVAEGVVAAAFDERAVPPELVWLRTLAPALRIVAVDVGGGASVAVGIDDDGWFGVVAIDGARGGIDDADGVPLTALAELVDADRAQLSAAQLLVHPDGRVGWLAVRLSAVDAVGIERGAAAVTATEARRAARLLAGLGLRAEPLDAAGLAAALVFGMSLDGPPQEHWSHWRAGSFVHTCYEAAWPPQVPLVAPGVTLSVTVEPGAGVAGVRVLARITARPADLAQLCREVDTAATAAGVRLRRLDGDHAPATWATAPSAAPVRH
jgi:type VII secretion protein EccE